MSAQDILRALLNGETGAAYFDKNVAIVSSDTWLSKITTIKKLRLRIAELEQRADRDLRIALNDAIQLHKGYIPKTAEPFYDHDLMEIKGIHNDKELEK